MYIWQRSWVYRIWVVGGILAVIGITVGGGLSAEPGDDTPLKTAVIAVGVWMAGLLLLTWMRLAGDRRQGAYGLGLGPASAGTGELPADPAALMAALALDPVAPDELERTTDATWSFTVRGAALITVIGLGVAAGGVAYTVFGIDGTLRLFGEGGPALPYVFVPVVVAVLLGALKLPWQMRRAMEIGDRWLEPLGLAAVQMPSSTVVPDSGGGLDHRLVGQMLIMGRRHDRDVRVAIGAGGSELHLVTPVAPFEIVCDGGRLEAVDGSPGWAGEVAVRAGTDDRWQGVRFIGGPDGIVARRRGMDGNAWLADLWVAELLAAAAVPVRA